MTYKVIKQLDGTLLYFVNNQDEINANTHLNCIIGNDFDTANAKLLEIKNSFLERDSYLFGCNKEIIDGNNTTWLNVDLENDPEEGVYQVFNHFVGSYEIFNSLSQAKLKIEQLKQQTLELNGLNEVREVNFLPEPFIAPKSSTIPVTEL